MLHIQDDVTRFVGLGRKAIGEFASDHQTDDFFHSEFARWAGSNPGAISHDGDVIGDAEDFFHLVADVNDAAAFGLEHVDDPEEVFNLSFGQ